jgi:hypothetical protein
MTDRRPAAAMLQLVVDNTPTARPSAGTYRSSNSRAMIRTWIGHVSRRVLRSPSLYLPCLASTGSFHGLSDAEVPKWAGETDVPQHSTGRV